MIPARLLPLLLLSLMPTVASAHFPWLMVDQDNRAVLFFSEGIHEREYHTPDAVAQAEVSLVTDDQRNVLQMPAVVEDGFDGRRSQSPTPDGARLVSVIQYGVYHGTLLRYAAKHQPLGQESADSGLPLDASVTPAEEGGLAVHVAWQKEPLAGVDVSLTDAEGQAHDAKTDDQGAATFASLPAGEVGLIVGHMNEGKGTHEDTPYTSESYYVTLTSRVTQGAAEESQSYPKMPAAVASFGGAVAEGWLYVYGGHTGEEHVHTRDNLSSHFARLKLEGGEQWEELPMQTPLQGLPLVAHEGKLYRVGGLNHRNAANEDPDMHSTDEFACFDPAEGEWNSLAPLPHARSSHDAVVIGDRLYVVGGWTLAGESPGDWRPEALVYDFTNPEAGWQTIADPPVRRRALAVAQLDGRPVALGGMQQDGGITDRVSAYDPASDTWTELPELPGEHNGFGLSAWSMGGALYIAGAEGVIYALQPGQQEWTKIAELDDPRFFHRLLPAGEQSLLVVAGASTADGHVATIELVDLSKAAPTRKRPTIEEF